jgi:hypothetical protein
MERLKTIADAPWRSRARVIATLPADAAAAEVAR